MNAFSEYVIIKYIICTHGQTYTHWVPALLQNLRVAVRAPEPTDVEEAEVVDDGLEVRVGFADLGEDAQDGQTAGVPEGLGHVLVADRLVDQVHLQNKSHGTIMAYFYVVPYIYLP